MKTKIRTTFLIGLLIGLYGAFHASTCHACGEFMIQRGKETLAGTEQWSCKFSWSNCWMVNKRNVSKKLLYDHGHPFQWVSKYGSVTSTDIGREFPWRGINEAGLYVSYPGNPQWDCFRELQKKGEVNAMQWLHDYVVIHQWIQYQLDSFASVKEVLDNVATADPDTGVPFGIRTGTGTNEMPAKAKVWTHTLLCDRSGAMAGLQFDETGKIVVVRTDTDYLKVTAGANRILVFHPEPETVVMTGDAHGFRVVDRLRMRLKNTPPMSSTPLMDLSWELLNDDRWKVIWKKALEDPNSKDKDLAENTKWWDGGGAIFDINNMEIHFKVGSAKKKTMQLSSFDFSNATPVLMLDAYIDSEGDIAKEFKEYTPEANRNFMHSKFDGGEPEHRRRGGNLYKETAGLLRWEITNIYKKDPEAAESLALLKSIVNDLEQYPGSTVTLKSTEAEKKTENKSPAPEPAKEPEKSKS